MSHYPVCLHEKKYINLFKYKAANETEMLSVLLLDPRMNVMSSATRFNNTSMHVLQAHEEH